MITKTEPGLSRPNDNPFDLTSSGQQQHQHNQQHRTAHVGHSGVAPVQPYRHHVDFTAEEKAQLDSDLSKYLPAEFTATRSGPGRSTLTYVEGWKIKNLANKLFGFNGWSSAITDVTIDFLEVENDGKVSVGVSCIVRVTLKDGTYHEDVGYGSSENQRSKAASFEKARKEAATDALKRALTSFGNLLGTCLYDKNYCKYVSNQRVDKTKFEGAEFYTYPTEARTHPQAAKPPPPSKPNQPVQPQQNSYPPQQIQQQNQQQNLQQNPFQNLQQNQQPQTGAGVNSSAQANSWSAGPSNSYKPDGAQQGSAAGKRPMGGPPFNGGSTASANVSSTTTSNGISMANPVAPPNKVSGTGNQVMNGTGAHMQTKIKVEVDDGKDRGDHLVARRRDSAYYSEEGFNFDLDYLTHISTDDLFFGPDLDDSAPSQALPESPRMGDFENLDVDLGDMLNDDSPIKPKATTSNFVAVSSNTLGASNNGLPATPRRSGSFGRSTSSPSLVQTTPTKKSQQEAQRNQGLPPGAPFRATTPVPFAELNAFKNPAYAPRSASPQALVLNNNQGDTRPTSTSQNRQSGGNIGSRAQTPQGANDGLNINRTITGAAQSSSMAKAGPADVLRANSLAASTSVAKDQHGNNNNTSSGYRPPTNYITSGQAHNIYGNNNGAGLKRPFINNGSHDLQSSTANKEPRLD
ncbi:DNA repair protein rad52 [Mortierella sp. 14UC]|nr:DNA repair protein rad52 [Mortierella sp. 14UC]